MNNKSFMIVRHGYDDHSYIDGKNDTSLTKDGIEVAKKAAEKIINSLDSENVIIRHSIKKRGCETAEIFSDYFTKNGFNCSCIKDNGLTELYQGNLNFEGMEHQEKIDFLQSCWDDFEECRMNGDLRHNFGERKDRNIMRGLGENHLEWSLRIADGLLNIIKDMENNNQSINIAHRGVIYEIEQLVKLANGLIDYKDVETYKTRWMSYCQDYELEFDDLNKAKKLIKTYKDLRS